MNKATIASLSPSIILFLLFVLQTFLPYSVSSVIHIFTLSFIYCLLFFFPNLVSLIFSAIILILLDSLHDINLGISALFLCIFIVFIKLYKIYIFSKSISPFIGTYITCITCCYIVSLLLNKILDFKIFNFINLVGYSIIFIIISYIIVTIPLSNYIQNAKK